MSNHKNGLPIAFIIGLTILALVATGAVINWIAEDTPTVQTQSTEKTGSAPAPTLAVELPLVNLDGEWRADNDGSTFVALISNDVITINLENADVSLIYWHGTFSTPETTNVAIGSTAVDIAKPVMSRAPSKTFQLKDDTLSFEFTAMGSTKTVVLTRA